MWETIQSFISTVGFPIFVAVFMLTKQSKDNELMRQAVNDLKTAIMVMQEKGDNKK